MQFCGVMSGMAENALVERNVVERNGAAVRVQKLTSLWAVQRGSKQSSKERRVEVLWNAVL